MNPDFLRAPTTPKYVLSVLQDDHRQQCAFDPEADPYARLSFASSIAEWRDACDLVSTDDLGIALNGSTCHGTALPDDHEFDTILR